MGVICEWGRANWITITKYFVQLLLTFSPLTQTLVPLVNFVALVAAVQRERLFGYLRFSTTLCTHHSP